MGDDEIEDADGKPHDWRSELIAELASQAAAGRIVGQRQQQWLEGDANLVYRLRAAGFVALPLGKIAHAHRRHSHLRACLAAESPRATLSVAARLRTALGRFPAGDL